MTSVVRYAALIVLLVLSVSCDGSAPGSPTFLTGGASSPTPPPPAPPSPLAPLTVTGVTPPVGFAGMDLGIQGTGFLPGAIVTLGGSQALRVRAAGSYNISVLAPEHASGAVDVVVVNPGGETTTLPGGFLFLSASLTVTPSSATPGDQLRVDWTSESQALQGPRHFGDWIGLFRVGDSNFDPISDLGISGSSGTLMWLAPGQPGQYEFRYFVGGVGIGGDDLEAARSHPVTVAGNVAVGAVTSAPLRAPRR